jgi:hypothetical protein
VAKIGNPGKARAMEVTAFKAIGLIAVPAESQKKQWSAYQPLGHTALHIMAIPYWTNFKFLYL